MAIEIKGVLEQTFEEQLSSATITMLIEHQRLLNSLINNNYTNDIVILSQLANYAGSYKASLYHLISLLTKYRN